MDAVQVAETEAGVCSQQQPSQEETKGVRGGLVADAPFPAGDDREKDRDGLPAIYWALGCVEGKHQGVLDDGRQGGYLGMPLEPGECLEHGARPADTGRPVFPLACTAGEKEVHQLCQGHRLQVASHSTQVVRKVPMWRKYVCSVLGVNFRSERLRKSSGRSDLAKAMAKLLCWPSLGRICPQRSQHAWRRWSSIWRRLWTRWGGSGARGRTHVAWRCMGRGRVAGVGGVATESPLMVSSDGVSWTRQVLALGSVAEVSEAVAWHPVHPAGVGCASGLVSEGLEQAGATDSCESRLLSDEGGVEADGVIGESSAAWMRSLSSLASSCGGSRAPLAAPRLLRVRQITSGRSLGGRGGEAERLAPVGPVRPASWRPCRALHGSCPRLLTWSVKGEQLPPVAKNASQ